ncbi:hypothetical protein [Halomonas sp. SpR8]|uniref:hypothetical protein n=1 Tax=Halomonas sp. SpR8 TaxID=3050463 RepID=UPI0027E518CE|nr:hypothetical protein [Halomonas sp. SpR8]MDQ7729688.1 hypothetical protein [Halomonas sp. SpR8]
MSYQPSIEDIAYLAEHQPERFSSPATTLRSIQNAMQADDVQRETLEAMTAQNHYNDFLANDGQALTESPIPREPVEEESRQDPEFGAMCIECASLTPCIEQVEVVCHAGENTRVVLQGENELSATDCKIYFVADQFATGVGTFEDFLAGTQLKDEGQVTITLASNCPHEQHTLYWTDELNGTALASGATSTVDFTVMTQPVPPITLPSVLMGVVSTNEELAFKAAVMLLNVLMNRTAMVNEERFRISYDGTNDFHFTTVTLPQLKFDGLVTIAPPTIDTRPVEKREGRMIAAEQSMGSRVRQVTARQGWGIHADLTVVCGAKNTTISVGKSPSETETLDTGPSLGQAENQRQQQNTVERFIGTLTEASQRIAKNLSGTENDGGKPFSFYTRGPELMLGATTEQVEESGGPGTSWEITPGLSLAYECGVQLDIYEALKIAARGTGGGAVLVQFLESVEDGFNVYFAEGQLMPALFMEVGLGVGPEGTEDTLGNHMLRATYNVQANAFEQPEGQVSITLSALVSGGMMGYFDSLFTERTVFKYGVQVATSGSIAIAIENGQWGYQLSHAGAMLSVQGYKKADTSDRKSQSSDGGFPTQTHRSSSQIVETDDGTHWQEDGGVHSYRLADSWTGAFHPFNNAG